MNAFSIPGQRATEIMEEEVHRLFDSIEEQAMFVLLDGTFPGTKVLPSLDRWEKYRQKTDVADLPLLEDDNYLQAYKDGLTLAPVSPFWATAISIPSLYKKLRTDFQHLKEEFGS